jgi:hypothetical protein
MTQQARQGASEHQPSEFRMTLITDDDCLCINFADHPPQRLRHGNLAGYREPLRLQASLPRRFRALLSQPLGRLQGGPLRLETATDVQHGGRFQRFRRKRRGLECPARFEDHDYEGTPRGKQRSCLAQGPFGGGRPVEGDDYGA